MPRFREYKITLMVTQRELHAVREMISHGIRDWGGFPLEVTLSRKVRAKLGHELKKLIAKHGDDLKRLD